MCALTYIIFAEIELVTKFMGKLSFKEGEDYKCQNNAVIVSLNNKFSGYMLFYATIILVYSMMIYVIFFGIPKKFGLTN